MATKEHWEVDPFNDREMWLKVIGQEREDPTETKRQADKIFERTKGYQRYSKCLEIGAGVGRLVKAASSHYEGAFGVDSSVSMVAMSTRYLRGYDDCRVILSDGLHLPFLSDYFHFVYSFTCFQHMENLETIQKNLCEALRVLLPGGICRIQTVLGDPASGNFDGYVFPSAEEFAGEFRRAGFHIISAVVDDLWIWVTAEK